MKPVELIFSYKPYNFGSWLIRQHQEAPYSHTCIRFFSNYMEMELIYEANHSGVRILPYSTWQKESNVVTAIARFEVSEEMFRRKLQRAFYRLEKPYGVSTLLGILMKGELNIGLDGDRSFICSECAYDFLQEELPKLGKPKDLITPRDLLQLALTIGVSVNTLRAG
jgi:uncharacterized protein YycO